MTIASVTRSNIPVVTSFRRNDRSVATGIGDRLHLTDTRLAATGILLVDEAPTAAIEDEEVAVVALLIAIDFSIPTGGCWGITCSLLGDVCRYTGVLHESIREARSDERSKREDADDGERAGTQIPLV